MIKKFIFAIVFLLIAAGAVELAAHKSFGKIGSSETAELAATVNGKQIFSTTIDRELARKPMLQMQVQMAGNDQAKLAQVRSMALEGMIDHQLLLEAATATGGIDEAAISASVDAVVKQYGGDAQLSELLNGIKTDLATFKSEVADDARIKAYIEHNIPKQPLDADAARKLYDATPERFATQEQVHARHILINLAKNASTEEQKAAKQKIDTAYARVTKPGSDFAAVAREVSQCPSAPQGGDLGFFPKGAMVPEFEQAAFALKPGEISKPIQTQFGYHIIKNEEHKAAAPSSFESARPQIERMLEMKSRTTAIQAHIKALREKAQIQLASPNAHH